MIGLEEPVLDFVIEPVIHLAVYDVADETVLKEIVAWESPDWPVVIVGVDKVEAANDGKIVPMRVPIKRNNNLKQRPI